MRRPLKRWYRLKPMRARKPGSALADEEAIETVVKWKIGGCLLPAVPWPMRRPLKLSQAMPMGPTSTGSALADEEAIETRRRLPPMDDYAPPAVPWPMRRPLKRRRPAYWSARQPCRQCLGR